MASQKLSGSNFFVKGFFEVLDDDSIFLKRADDATYEQAIVSKDVFTFNTNKSVVFTFKADPFTEVKRSSTVWFSKSNFAYVNNLKELIVNGKSIYQLTNGSFTLKGSDKYVGLLDGSKLNIFDISKGSSSASASGSSSGSSNGNNNVVVDNVIDFDVTDNAYGFIYMDNGKAKAGTVVDDNKNPIKNIPDNVNNYSDSKKAPVQIAVGDKIGLILLKDGTIVNLGDVKYDYSGNYYDVEAEKSILGAVDITNSLTIVDTSTSKIETLPKVSFFSIGADGTISTVSVDGTYKNNTCYPVEVYSADNKEVIVCRNGNITSTNLDIVNLIPYEPMDNSKEFALHPVLDVKDAFNVMFGVQTNNLDPKSTKTYVNVSGETVPIIVGDNQGKDLFKTIAKDVKGFFYSKYADGSDVFLNSKGQNLGEFVVEGANVLPSQLVDFQNNIYKLVITFSPFGKSLRVFKAVDGEFIEIKAKFLSLEEDPFPSGRIALYIKSASSFHLMEVEITDELDVTLLPEEIIYRDLDTNILQTKVAESLNKHVESYEKVVEAIEKQAEVLKKVTKIAQEKFNSLDDRLKKLGNKD